MYVLRLKIGPANIAKTPYDGRFNADIIGVDSVLDFSWTNNRRVRIFSYWILVFAIIASMFSIAHQSAFAGGSVPPSAVEAYPGLDPRLVGVPIVKTDMSEALVAYSQAVAHVGALETEKTTLQSNITVLGPENIRAQEVAKIRTQEYNDVAAAHARIVLAQYQDVTRDVSNSEQTPDELRLTHQSVRVSGSLRESKKKAESRKADADAYALLVNNSITSAHSRIAAIDGELVTAKERARDQRDTVRSGIPVALIEGLEIPVLTMDAYLRAEKTLSQTKPECGLTWWALAGIGRAESNHGRFHGALLDVNGTVSPAIIGVALNGNGFAAIGDSDLGLLDGDTQWDHAVGVMQFIPGTWKGYAQDGNGDGKIDPQNVYDAALAAANLLCANARPNMSTEEGRRTAFMRYNASQSYVDFVATRGHEYEVLGVGRFNPAPVDATAPSQ